MDDMYAVVNKYKNLHPPVTNSSLSDTTPHRSSKSLPPSHYYDNDPVGEPAAPIYSCVKVRAKPSTTAPSITTVYDIAMPAKDCQLRDEQLSSTNDEYEEFSTVSDASAICPHRGIGFNLRIQRPKGPREPPANWC